MGFRNRGIPNSGHKKEVPGMTLRIYGSTDAENLVKILLNSGYRVTIIGYNDERPYRTVWTIEVKE